MKTIIAFLLLIISVVSYSQTVLIDKAGKTVLDISTMNATDTIHFTTKPWDMGSFSVHVVFSDVTGTPNCSVELFSSNDITALPFKLDTPVKTINASNYAIGYEKDNITFKNTSFLISKNGATGGFIEIYYRKKL